MRLRSLVPHLRPRAAWVLAALAPLVAIVAIVALVALAPAVLVTAHAPRGETASPSTASDRADELPGTRRPAAGSPAAAPAPSVVGRRVETTGAPVTPGGSAGVDHVPALRLGLASPDEATRIAAVEAAVGATAVETLGELENFDLKRDPEAAPTVIHAVALLGASAEGQKRDEAARTLTGWLRDERKREGPDVAGNISNLVEALGDVGGSSAVDALGQALDRADLPLHVETLAVMKLGELGDARARGPVERFTRRALALPAVEGIDEELRVEAIAAARTTLSKI